MGKPARPPHDPKVATHEDVLQFRECWQRLAEASAVDDWGSMECRHRFKEWLLAGKPRPITTWIMTKQLRTAPPEGK
jgi:hypothetical protein